MRYLARSSAEYQSSAQITALAISPDGTHIATADQFGKVHMLDKITGNETILRHSFFDSIPRSFHYEEDDLAFSPNGRRLAYLEKRERVFVIFDINGGHKPTAYSTAADPHTSKPLNFTSITWSPRSDELLCTAWSPAITSVYLLHIPERAPLEFKPRLRPSADQICESESRRRPVRVTVVPADAPTLTVVPTTRSLTCLHVSRVRTCPDASRRWLNAARRVCGALHPTSTLCNATRYVMLWPQQ